MTGIKEAGHTEIQPLLFYVAEVVAVMNGLAVSRVLLLTDTTAEAQNCQSHVCLTHCVFTGGFLSEYSGGKLAQADLIIMTV